MHRRIPRRPSCLFLMLAAALALNGPLKAQSTLCIEHEHKMYGVRTVRAGRAFVEIGGKLVAAGGKRCAMVKAEEYLPFFISVEGKKLVRSQMVDVESGRDSNHQLHFEAEFKSPYLLENVFVVLEMELPVGGKELFFYEVGRLEPNVARPLGVTTPFYDTEGRMKYKLHLFSDGSEVLQSEQPPAFRESVLDRMVAREIATVRQAAPKFFIGPEAEYPAALRKAGVKGSVTLALRISAHGVVMDPVVKNATDPAFGESALAAVRQWRFLPRIENGKPQDARITLPIDFELRFWMVRKVDARYRAGHFRWR